MSDFIDLKGKTFLVTGGSRGIGEGIVRALVREGADVVLHYNSGRERARAIAEQLGSHRCLTLHGDLARYEDIDTLWAKAIAWKGKIDVVVNNAAVRHAIPLTASSTEWDERWMETLRTNLLGTAHLCRHSILHFQKTGGGIIIGISARTAVRGDRPDFFHDGASKGGINSLLRGIARFYASDNIQTYIVCAGVIDTAQADDMRAIYGSEELLREIPAGHFGTPEDVANVVIFCASGKASYSSGATIDVTGASFLH